jgi:hypothetical protein
MADADKWGIPFFYPTASNAGVTGKGNGFFWQQSNDIQADNEDGMVRLGKEDDDVEVINKSTGEFEFPFDSGADYFCLEVRQGHKSGGEEHGCEGSCYIFNVLINQTPAKFFWQKQMYHGGSKYIDPKTKEFGHAKVTEKVIGNSWKGFCAVIYNKEDGRSEGHDSAILEIWWNEDPVNNLKNGWFMVKRTEDKGGWGKDGDSCDGVDDQVITWSNIQFRLKSGTPDFSLHPLIPEFEDGPVIHSIGEEDMSFEDSEKRGYGKRADMPANVEMKCLFKFDSTNGKARIKNLSLREIDPTKGFDDDPDQPNEPKETQVIQGKFKLQWDLNTSRASACAGAGAGGAGGSAIFYDLNTIEADSPLSNHVDHQNRTRVAQECTSSSNEMYNKLLKQLDVQLMKEGTPGASPTVTAKIWNASNVVVATSSTTVDPTSLSDSVWTEVLFDFSSNTHTIVVGDRVGIEYTGTSDTNYVIGPIRVTSQRGGHRAVYESGAWRTVSTSDFVCHMWE